MDQIKYIRDLIGEKLSLEAQFGLNREDQNFRGPNSNFTKSKEWNHKQNCKKIKFWGQLKVKLEKFTNNDLFEKDVKF